MWRRFRRSFSSFLRYFVYGPIVQLWRVFSPDRLLRLIGNFFRWIYRLVRGKETSARPARSWWYLLFSIPAIVVAIAAVVVTMRSFANQRELGQQYWQQAVSAISSNDFQAAQLYLMRAQGTKDIDSREVRFALAAVWDQLGYTGRALEIFNELAPVNRVGFPKAHRHFAILISAQNQTQRSNELLSRWLWHLTHADDQSSADVQQAWGTYYLAVDDLRAAIGAFAKAASRYPRLYLTISNLHERLGQVKLKQDMLMMSRDRFREELSENPNDRDSRVIYATTLLQLGELSEAEQVLQTGLRLDPEGPYKLLLAAMFVQLHDKLMERGPEAHAVALQQLQNAFEFDPNFEPALTRLLGFAQVEKGAIPELRKMLSGVLASGQGASITHLALSNLAWIEGNTDVATFHLQQAIALDSKMPVIANNLAWVLAHSESPDLVRALEISNAVVEDYPDNARFLDTRAEIYFLGGKYRESLVDSEKALPQMPDAKPVHKRIAQIYKKLGMDEIAREHAKLAGAEIKGL